MKPTCLALNCSKEPAVNCRGLCMKCYSAAKKLVTNGNTTWEALEEMGLAQRELTPLEIAFNKKKVK